MHRFSTKMDNVGSVSQRFPLGCGKSGGASDAQSLNSKMSAMFEFCILLVFVASYPSTVSAANFSMRATSFNCESNLICLGQAHEYTKNSTDDGNQVQVLSLIWEPPYPENNLGAGVAYYNEPVRLLDPSSRQSASFNTSFSLDVVEARPPHHGDGLAFVISADKETLGSERAFFGIFNTDGMTPKKSIVVEFDQHMNRKYPMYDISGNHVSVDFGNITAAVAANASDVDVVLWNNLTTYVWVEYSNHTQQLEVRLSNNNSRPIRPLLNCSVDLFEVIEEYMWVGISAGSGDFYDNYYVSDWTFESFGIPPSGPSVSLTQKARDNLGLIVKIAVFIPALLIAASFITSFVEKVGYKPIAQDDLTLNLLDFPKCFSYEDLSLATNGFNEEPSSKLGKGGSGHVYRGQLPPGIPVAVKKIISPQRENEFKSEVSIITRLRHKNLIKLLGWCRDEPKSNYLLVYELMSKGSLDKWLLREGGEERDRLSWLQKVNIVNGIALALEYMHHGCNPQIIHGDIKPSNIMLDDQFNGKLGDFGLSRVADCADKNSSVDIVPNASDDSNANFSRETEVLAGTLCYLAPERWSEGSKCNAKTDVYAFGVVVLELTCGCRSVSRALPGEEALPDKEISVVDWVWHKFSKGILPTALEAPLCYYDEPSDPIRMDPQVMLRIGLLCTHSDPEERPSMEDVVRVLARIIKVPPIPPRTGRLAPEACRSPPQSIELLCRTL